MQISFCTSLQPLDDAIAVWLHALQEVFAFLFRLLLIFMHPLKVAFLFLLTPVRVQLCRSIVSLTTIFRFLFCALIHAYGVSVHSFTPDARLQQTFVVAFT